MSEVRRSNPPLFTGTGGRSNIKQGTITVWNLILSWRIPTQISYSCRKVANSGTTNLYKLLGLIA